MMGIITVQREMNRVGYSERNEQGGIYRRFIQKYTDLWKRAVA
jgi:hypothetical protein